MAERQSLRSSLNEVAAEGLRAILTKYVRTFTAGETALVAQTKMKALLAELDECSVKYKELKANA